MSKESKKFFKDDKHTRKFIIEVLGDNETHGMDIDSIYYVTENKWIIFEFLYCETIEPHESHPHRYPFNWRKFASLFEIKEKLEGELWLVNFSYEEKWKNQVKVIKVKNLSYDKIKEWNEYPGKFLDYLETEEKNMTLEQFKKIYQNINKIAIAPWKEKI